MNCSGELPVEEQLAKGDFKFHLTGEKLRGDFALVYEPSAEQGQRMAAAEEEGRLRRAGLGSRRSRAQRGFGRTQEEIAKRIAPGARLTPRRVACRAAIARKFTARIRPPCRKTFRRCWRRSAKGDLPLGDDWLYEDQMGRRARPVLPRPWRPPDGLPATATAWSANIPSSPSSRTT